MFSSQIDSAFQEEVPMAFLHDSVRLCRTVYRRAFEDYSQLRREPVRDGLGHHRRTLIESEWPSVAERHPGVTVSYQQNRQGSSNYARVVCGRFVLTQSAVNDRYEMVRSADFRLTLARSSQLMMFDDAAPPQPAGNAIYGLLIHGPMADQQQPAFVDVVFPDPECRCYVHRIRLEDVCFATWDAGGEPTTVEEIEDTLVPTLRPNQNRQS